MNLASASVEQLFHQLRSGASGLTALTARRRGMAQKRKSRIESRSRRELKLLLNQFRSPLMILLIVVVILSGILGETSDALIVLVILLISVLLSFLQELHAGRAVEKLLHMIEVKHRVVREGREEVVPAKEVVPGDVVLLNAGDLIPADCRILETNELHVNESSLTGESYPVAKMAGVIAEDSPLHEKSNCLWQGTSVVSGTARALAVYTGNDTVFGQMAHSLIQDVPTAFEAGLKSFGYFLLRITVLLALAVGMAPELLPAIMTFSMAAGANRMVERKVIVKRLSSIFNFGEVNLLCTDKTGTITEGSAKVHDIVNLTGQSDARAQKYAFLNASLQQGFTNPIDEVIRALPLTTEGYEKLDEIPYDFIRKRLSILVKGPGGNIIITKGALPIVLQDCDYYQDAAGTEAALDETARQQIEARLEAYSGDGFRVLGITCKATRQATISHQDERSMVFQGFILLEDRLKAGAQESIERLERMGIRVKIITGDNRFAARHAARALGMNGDRILTGQELNTMAPEALTVKAATVDIFAEIEPHQKERIVRALQQSRYRVAYLGDGINDVAAIHAADTGISTSNAVDVAKEAADFVLLEKDLEVLADGVHEGRKSFANSMKYIFATTGATFGNMFSVAGASLLLPFLPMLPKQILLTNLLSDFPYLAVATDRVDDEQLLKPLKWDIHLIRRFMLVFGLHSSLFDFITFYTLFVHFRLRDAPFQTGWFLESIATELIIIFVIRTRKPLFRSKPGGLLLAIALLALVITIWLPLSPLAAPLSLTLAHQAQAVALISIVLAYLITAELLKLWFFRSMAPKLV